MNNMIKALLLVVGLLSFSCEEVLDRFTKFEINNESSFTIAATTLIDTPVALNTPEIESNENNEFSNNNSRKDLIESAKIRRMELAIESPAEGSFNFLNEIELFINAEGLEETRIASKFDIENTDSKTLMLDVDSDTELSQYLKKDKYSIRVRAVTDQTINEDYEIKVNSKFFIDAEVLGI
ncbi:hypothetical protein [Aquimarina agarivorans]|uniref:hypothetical protein n=1 Tax=Aquimarina agarivorans TaxID=980584 RepID=UPI000248F288|nr:hypothetical protein [Aquimarina agarivorans]